MSLVKQTKVTKILASTNILAFSIVNARMRNLRLALSVEEWLESFLKLFAKSRNEIPNIREQFSKGKRVFHFLYHGLSVFQFSQSSFHVRNFRLHDDLSPLWITT